MQRSVIKVFAKRSDLSYATLHQVYSLIIKTQERVMKGMRGTIAKKLGCILIFSFLSQFALADSSINQQIINIPMQTEQGTINLETMLVVPNDNKSHPVVLINHGTPRDSKQREEITPLSFLPQAYEFARRGYAVAVVMRRGYGGSGGGIADKVGSCEHPDYKHATENAVADLKAAMAYLATQKQFDTSQLVVVGISAGGLASIGFSALSPPSGLKAVISFAGGRGSYASDKLCHPELLSKLFAEYGKTSTVPTLWIYAENDHFFSPSIGQGWSQGFIDNGGQATFIKAPSFGEDGHFLFSGVGIPIWTPIVDNFLKENKLPLTTTLLPLPESSLKTPENLSYSAKKAFETYKGDAPHKAFAVSPKGAYGWQTGKRTTDEAQNVALENCSKYDTDCTVIAVDDQYIGTPFKSLATPNNLSGDAATAFAKYNTAAFHKAFAWAPDGSYGWRTGRETKEDAMADALKTCGKYSSQCKLIAVDDELQ